MYKSTLFFFFYTVNGTKNLLKSWKMFSSLLWLSVYPVTIGFVVQLWQSSAPVSHHPLCRFSAAPLPLLPRRLEAHRPASVLPAPHCLHLPEGPAGLWAHTGRWRKCLTNQSRPPPPLLTNPEPGTDQTPRWSGLRKQQVWGVDGGMRGGNLKQTESGRKGGHHEKRREKEGKEVREVLSVGLKRGWLLKQF